MQLAFLDERDQVARERLESRVELAPEQVGPRSEHERGPVVLAAVHGRCDCDCDVGVGFEAGGFGLDLSGPAIERRGLR